MCTGSTASIFCWAQLVFPPDCHPLTGRGRAWFLHSRSQTCHCLRSRQGQPGRGIEWSITTFKLTMLFYLVCLLIPRPHKWSLGMRVPLTLTSLLTHWFPWVCLHFILKHESFLYSVKFCNMRVSGTSPSWYTFISVNRDSFLLRLQGSSRRTGYWQWMVWTWNTSPIMM